MDDLENAHQKRNEFEGDPSMYLSLYIILLTFFIALVSVSVPNMDRAQRVVDSVAGIFSVSGPSVFLEEADLSQSGRVLAVATHVFSDIGSLFQAEIPLAKIRERSPGRVLEASFPARELFLEGSAKVRPSRVRLMDRVLAALSYGAREGISRRMTITFATGESHQSAYPGADSLEHRRAVALGDLAYQRGAAAQTVEIGLAPGPIDRVTFTFRIGAVRDGAEDR